MELTTEDAAKLAQDSRVWIDGIINYYRNESKTIYINESNIGTLFPKELTDKLDNLTQEDLGDGILCILHLEPTPAAMILFRVAEKIVRKYYEKTTNNPSTGLSWGNIVTNLKNAQAQKTALIGYLDYLRNKRNDAEHPDKRFKQEESERIALHVKGLIEETL